MPDLRLNLLGKPEVWLDDAPVTAFSTAKTEALLYYLALTGRPHSRGALARLFWGDMPDAPARRNLTKSLSVLRNLAAPYLVLERQDVAFNVEAPHTLDVTRFEAALTAARAGHDPEALQAAAALYRGDLLEGFAVKDAQDFEEWALVERERLRELALRVLDELVEQGHHLGEYAAATEHARRLLDLDPWRESAHRQLITLLARQGQHSAALAQYEKCRQLLAAELGVEPMAETTALYERIRLARLAAPRPLPAEVEPFAGRAAELAQIRRRLADPACRLLTIVGAGGMGKTRLALAAARHLNQGSLPFLNGVVFVPLADVPGAASVPAALAEALEVPLASQARAALAVVDWLHNKELLLVLDNFEHLADGADWLTQLLSRCPHLKLLVTSREPLHLAAEWRLNLEGLAYPPEGQAPGAAGPAHAYEAVQLFVQAARQVQPDFELTPDNTSDVYHLCQVVAGTPLALKLAAAWTRVMTVAQIVAEVERCLDILATPMRDVPLRQRSLRAIFDGAYDRLTPAAQRAWVALAVFRGGFRQAAAEQVAGATLPILAALVDQALAQARPDGRYHLHPLLRQYGGEKLAQSVEAEAEARQQHSAYYLNLLTAREAALSGPGQRAALTEVGEDIENVQDAWRWAVTQAEVNVIDAALGPLYTFFQVRSRFQEGEALLTWTVAQWQGSAAVQARPEAQRVQARLLARWGAFGAALHDFEPARERLQTALAEAADPGEQALALFHLGWMVVDQGDRATAEDYLRRSLSLSRACGDRAAQADALNGLAKAAFEEGDFAPACELARQVLAICREVGRPDRVAGALSTLAWPTNCLGAYAEAEGYWREALGLYRQLGDAQGAAMSVGFLGWGAWCVGGARLPEALAHYETALAAYRESGNRSSLAMCLGDIALAAGELGDAERAVRSAREGLAVAQEAGILHLVNYNLAVLGGAATLRGDLALGRQSLARVLRTGLVLQKKDGVMLGLYFLARLRLVEGEAAAAQPLLDLVAQHPATWQPIRERAQRLAAQVAPDRVPATADGVPAWDALAQRLGIELEILEKAAGSQR